MRQNGRRLSVSIEFGDLPCPMCVWTWWLIHRARYAELSCSKLGEGTSLNSPLPSFFLIHHLLPLPPALPIFFLSPSFSLFPFSARKIPPSRPVASRLLHKQVYGFPGWQLSCMLSSTSHCTPSCFCDHFSLTGNGIWGSALPAVCSNYSLSRLSSCFQAWVSQSPRVFWQCGSWKVCSLSLQLNGFSKASSGHTETGRRFDKTFWILLAFSSPQKKMWFGKGSFRSALRGVSPPSVMFCNVFILVCVDYLRYLCFLRDLLS